MLKVRLGIVSDRTPANFILVPTRIDIRLVVAAAAAEILDVSLFFTDQHGIGRPVDELGEVERTLARATDQGTVIARVGIPNVPCVIRLGRGTVLAGTATGRAEIRGDRGRVDGCIGRHGRQVGLLDLRKDLVHPVPFTAIVRITTRTAGVSRAGVSSAIGKHSINVVVVVKSQPDLFEIILALRPPRRFARLLNGRQQQRDQYRNDGDHHQQFNQGKPPRTPRAEGSCRFKSHACVIPNKSGKLRVRVDEFKSDWNVPV